MNTTAKKAEPKNIHGKMMAIDPLQGAEAERFAASYELCQLLSACANQIRSDMSQSVILRRRMSGLRGELDDALGNVFLCPARAAGKLLDRLTIPITCIEIHRGIDCRMDPAEGAARHG